MTSRLMHPMVKTVEGKDSSRSPYPRQCATTQILRNCSYTIPKDGTFKYLFLKQSHVLRLSTLPSDCPHQVDAPCLIWAQLLYGKQHIPSYFKLMSNKHAWQQYHHATIMLINRVFTNLVVYVNHIHNFNSIYIVLVGLFVMHHRSKHVDHILTHNLDRQCMYSYYDIHIQPIYWTPLPRKAFIM